MRFDKGDGVYLDVEATSARAHKVPPRKVFACLSLYDRTGNNPKEITIIDRDGYYQAFPIEALVLAAPPDLKIKAFPGQTVLIEVPGRLEPIKVTVSQ